MNMIGSMGLKYVIHAMDNSKIKKFRKMGLKYCKDIHGYEFSFISVNDSIRP